MTFNFSGWATKNDMVCSDGRIIRRDAFKHQDGEKVPLVWQHKHDEPVTVLGYAILHNSDDGMYTEGYFNDTEAGKTAKLLVEHGDIDKLSIWANQLKEKSKNVLHGVIKEVSLVLSGANPGAVIDNVILAHGGLGTPSYDQYSAIICSGELIEFDEIEHSNDENETMADIFEALSEKEKNVVYFMLEQVAAANVEHSDDDESDDPDEDEDESLEHGDQSDDENLEHSQNENNGGNDMPNVFDQNAGTQRTKPILSHDDMKNILVLGESLGSLKKAFLEHMSGMDEEVLAHAGLDKDSLVHANTYGIENIDILFPDAVAIDRSPDFDKRRTEWVAGVLNGVKHSPISRIKMMYADITADEARAKGYIKGNEKFEEVIKLFKRVTSPTTIYKKQKLDRNDITDIVDMDVVAWLKMEMRLMLDEEIARCIIIGDGRLASDPDKVDDECIRPIYLDDAKYSIKVPMLSTVTGIDEIEAIAEAMDNYKGSGAPTLYTTRAKMRAWKFIKDENGHYMFRNLSDVADLIGVKNIVDIEVMEGVSRDIESTEHDLLCIIVNLRDYTVGADKGGKLAFFDGFDIDFNQFKYLYETRISGSLTKIYSAVVVEKAQAAG